MKIPVEYLQVNFRAPEAPSALRLWLELFKDDEPTHSATDEDGDTNARGPRDGYWIDIQRIGDAVNLFATPVERRTAHDALVPFDAAVWSRILDEIIDRAAAIAETMNPERISLTIVSGQAYATNHEAMEGYRGLGASFALLPANSIDARYDFGVVKKSKALTDFGLRVGAQYRVGRRAVADPEGSYEAADGTVVSWTPHLGQVISVSTRGKADSSIANESIRAAYDEFAAIAKNVWETGVDAFG